MRAMEIQLEPAIVLHTRAYRDTSLLVDFFCLNQGRVTGVAKGARGMRSRFKGCLVPFSPLLMSGVSKTELLTITHAEAIGPTFFLQGENLFNGFYLNELLIKLLKQFDPYPELYGYYQEALKKLAQDNISAEILLRIFEKQLLSALGYGLQLNKEISGDPVSPYQFYFYHVGKGLVPCDIPTKDTLAFRGDHLLAIENNHFTTPEILKKAKQLIRPILGALLENQAIKSREFYLLAPLPYRF
jgi:DNA repair protein RecO (recombination protein O)